MGWLGFLIGLGLGTLLGPLARRILAAGRQLDQALMGDGRETSFGE